MSGTPTPSSAPHDGEQGGKRLEDVYAIGLAVWRRAERVAALLATDPHGLGGAHVLGGDGPAADVWLKSFASILPDDAPSVSLPPYSPDEALIGTLALDRSLATGTMVAEPGLLARADGGILIARMAEGMDTARAALITAAIDSGHSQIERTGLSQSDPARFALVALDSGEPDEAPPPGALLDRLAFQLPLGAIPLRCAHRFDLGRADIAAARSRLSSVRTGDEQVDTLVEAAARLGVQSLRAPLFVLRAARAIAALDGRDATGAEDLEEAASLVLAHRAVLSAEDEPPDPPPPPPPDASDTPETAEDEGEPDPSTLEDSLIDAVKSAAMASVLETLSAQLAKPPAKASRAGKSGASAKRLANGRPDRPVPRHRMRQGRIDLVSTLRAAAPFQTLRASQAKPPRSGSPHHGRLHLRSSDLQVKTHRHRTETTIIFLVDASGSSALNRMGEAKGAIEHLLTDCYSRRDNVALIAVRGTAAECLLQPTRALTRVRRALSSLPSGGTTPLASGLAIAGDIAMREAQSGRTPYLVILSDGRGNVALDGSTDRATAAADLDRVARVVAVQDFPAVFFDTSRRPSARADDLAKVLGADYRHLPFASAERISSAVRSAVGGR